MSNFNGFSENMRKTHNLITVGVGIVALIVYVMTLSYGVYPGESAQLTAQAAGLDDAVLPLHPVWSWIASKIAGCRFGGLALRLNLFSMLCTVLSGVLLYRIMSFFIKDTITEEYSVEYAERTAMLSGVVTTAAYLFSMPVWQSAIRLQYQSFDMLLLFASVAALILYARKANIFTFLLFVLLFGCGLAESSMFFAVSPIIGGLIVYILYKNNIWSVKRAAAFLFSLVFIGLLGYYLACRSFYLSNVGTLEFSGWSDVFRQVLRSHVNEYSTALPRVSWLVILLTGFIPWFAGMFASFRALNNERSWSEYMLHLAMTVFTVLGLANTPVSPWAILSPTGRLPVVYYTMIAMTAGYLFAYWYLMLKVKRHKRGSEVNAKTKAAGEWMGLLLAYPLAVFVALVAVINAFDCRGSRGAFADLCAEEIISRLGERNWFIADGALDAHLRIVALEKNRKLNMICLQRDMDETYLNRISKTIEKEKLFEGQKLKKMQHTLELGILPFLQDWFESDKDIASKVAVFGVPDFWYSGNSTPNPEFFFFGGISNVLVEAESPRYGEYRKFWDKMMAVLPKADKSELVDPVIRSRENLRRHLGFVANNFGVLQEDAAAELRRRNPEDPRIVKLEESAYRTYNEIREKIAPDNVSAMFNRFEMARRGVDIASAQKDVIERELKDFVTSVKHRYPLYSLSRIYGYVRSPELFARLGWGWALSGQTGAALAGIRSAVHLLPNEKHAAVLSSLANIYRLSGEQEKSESTYRRMLEENPEDEAAMLGLVRLSVQKGSLEQARSWLEKAAKNNKSRGALGVEWATIHIMNGDIARARVALQEATDMQPKNLRAWAMLAMVQIQQNELDEVETVTLPKMESIAGTTNNYYLQIGLAQLAMRRTDGLKGDNLLAMQRKARSHFIRASGLRPDIVGVKDMILRLDMAMNDRKDGELHARQVLRVDRRHALANYILGSLRLQEGEYGEAEDFLRRSVESSPSSAALNDLAEVLRRIRRYEDAERFARQAVEKAPNLYVAWETLGVIILERGGDLGEARKCVEKAIGIFKEDWRLQISLARILLKMQEVEQARALIAEVRRHSATLAKYDLEMLDIISAEASAAKTKK